MESRATSIVAAPDSGRVPSGALSVSVVMATYNGAAFLDAQLASIAAQTRAPDELVVCDDGSNDGTVEILERFARQAPFEVTIIRNQQRLGYGENFMKAGRCCRGDVIAWSDQDDVWMPEKLARCVREFEQDPEVLLVEHSTQIGMGAEGRKPLVSGPLGKYRSRPRELRTLRRRSVYTPASLPLELYSWGHSCVVSRRVLELGDTLATTIPDLFDQFSGHDTWTLILATAAGKAVLLPDVLVHYRQHGTQVAGAYRAGAPPRRLATRVAHSARRQQSVIVSNLEAYATRAFFRASVLTQLAALLDSEAGLGHDARAFRAAVEARVTAGRDVGYGRGAVDRAALWRRNGDVLSRRLEVWRQQSALRATTSLVRNAVGGDYGRADRGGLGLSLLTRDLWRVAQVAVRRSG
jgi:glycosyltransferase involved in cell wall biosynthesis